MVLTQCSRNQILLRLASVDLLNSDGQEIEFAVKRVLAVNEPSKVNKTEAPNPTQGGFTSVFPGAAELQQLQLELHSQREDIKRIDSNGFRIVVALDKRASRIQGEVAKLRGAVPDLQRDIESVRQEFRSVKVEIIKSRTTKESPTTLSMLEDRLARVTTAIDEVGKQVATFGARLDREIGELKWDLSQQEQEMADLRDKVRGSVLAADYAEDMANLRAELAQMRRQVDETHARETARFETTFPSRELEALTSTIAKVSSRASQIETLQMEVEILKGRVGRSEAGRQVAEDNRSARAIDPGLPRYSGVYSTTRKRGVSPSLEHAPKRPASSLGLSNPPSRRHATPNGPSIPPSANHRGVLPETDGIARIPSAARRGTQSPHSGTASATNGISSRLEKR